MMPNITQVSATLLASPKSPNVSPPAAAKEVALPQAISAAQQQDAVPSQAELDNAVSSLNEHMQSIRRDLNFSVDEDSGRVVVKVVDTETNEVIRQIPSEEVMALARGIKDYSNRLFEAQV